MRQYVFDAFVDERPFSGNPAAVCFPEAELADAVQQAVAGENHLSETAFVRPAGEDFRLRWFTPGGEIDLCGHATLAAAEAVFRFLRPGAQEVVFHTRSGALRVCRRGDVLEMNFPAYALRPVPVTEEMVRALGARPREAYLGRDLVCVLESEAEVRALAPDQEALRRLDGLLVHATAPGAGCDCASRSFAPKLAVPEDPVCGSGHCHIAPLWAAKCNKASLTARQASPRGGVLYCRVEGERVFLGGRVRLFSSGRIEEEALRGVSGCGT